MIRLLSDLYRVLLECVHADTLMRNGRSILQMLMVTWLVPILFPSQSFRISGSRIVVHWPSLNLAG